MKRRILSIITALALCLSLCPTWAFATEADPALCCHHWEHTEDCGYTAPSEGQPCGHEHTAECYTLGVLPDADSGNPYEVGGDTENLLDCQHSHDSECGYVQADPGTPCGYECRICPIEDLIAALPEQVTEDNADDVRAQLDHILDLYRELDEDEQEEINLSRIYALQGALDAANDPMPLAAGTVNKFLNFCTEYSSTISPAEGSGYKWDDATKTLTLTDFHQVVSVGFGIVLPDGSTLVLEGENTIQLGDNPWMGVECYDVNGSLALAGDGTLTVTSTSGRSPERGAVCARGLHAELTFENYICKDLSYKGMEYTIQKTIFQCLTDKDKNILSSVVPAARIKQQDGDAVCVAVLANAFSAEYSGAGVTLLRDVSNSGQITVNGDFRFDTDRHSITFNSGIEGGRFVVKGGTFQVNGSLTSDEYLFDVRGGTLVLEKGDFTAGICVALVGGKLEIPEGAPVTLSAEKERFSGASANDVGSALSVQSGSAALCGGSFEGNGHAIYGGLSPSNGIKLDTLLAQGYRYSWDGKPQNLSGKTYFNNIVGILGGSITDAPLLVEKCTEHKVVSWTQTDTGHWQTCIYCKTKTSEGPHVYSGEDPTCTVCGYSNVHTHTFSAWDTKDEDGDRTLTRTCNDCGYKQIITYTPVISVPYNHTGTVSLEQKIETVGIDSLTYKWENYNNSMNSWWMVFTSSFTPPAAGQSQKYRATITTSGFEDVPKLEFTLTRELCHHENMAWTQVDSSSHKGTCPDCSEEVTAAHTFDENGNCVCGATLAVTLTNAEGLIYKGDEHKPGVSVAVNDKTLTENTDYTVSYTGNINAGENTATVTVTGTDTGWTVTKTFSIGKATPTITWGSTTQELTYTGDPAAITAPTVTLVNNEQFAGTISYSYQKQGETAYKDDLPTDTGTYTIKAHVVAAGNYTAADSGEMTLTINPSPVTLTFNDQTITYGGTPTGATANPASADIKYSYITSAGGEPISGWPTNAGTYTVTAKVEATGNYEAATATAQLTINKAPLTITGAAAASKPYDGTDTAAVTGVTFTGLVTGETLALGTDYTATGTFADANAGEGKSVTVTVTLANTAKANNYNLTPNTTTATADITKVDPVVTAVSVSTPATIYESTSLGDIALTHGVGDTAGTVALNPSQTLTVGTKGYAWTFTPDDTNNYNTATGTISLTVAVDSLQSIAVTTPPSKTAYTYGESFDKAGMVITATYASGATKVVTGEVQISPAELTVTTTALTITYQGKTVTQAITVSPKEVTNPTIGLSPSSFVYDGTEKKPAVTVKDGEKMIPADEYTVEYSNNTNVGTTATVTITDKTGGNYTVSGSTTFTITAKPLTGARVEVTGTFTYTGNALTPAPTVTLDGETLTANTDYTVAYDKNTDAGTAKITVTGTGNYSGTAQGTFTIGKADLTVEGTGTASGTYGAKLSELTVSGLTAKLGEATVTGTWKLAGGTVPNVGDSGEYTATFTPATGTDNYNALTAKVKLNIAQATAPTPQTGTLNVQNGQNRDYTYDLSRLLPVLASGQSFGGEVTYTLKTVNITEAGYYESGTAVISGTTLTLPVKAVTSSTEGQIGTITVTISSKNFANVDATINVNRVNKQPVSIEGVTAQNGTYNGESHRGYTGTPTASPYSGGFKVTYAKADGTALSGPPTNAGDYTVTITLNENNDYTGSRTLSFTISKASITIKADDKRADVGAAKPALTYTVTGLVSGDTLATAPTLACDADMNTIGQYPITASGAAVPSGGNYNTTITYVAGTLNVTDPTISVTGVTLNKTSTTLTVGGSERLTATVAPSDATDKSVTWTSSNTAVATVDANGTVTAVSVGTATITVTTADGAKTATCTVTVRTNSSGGGSYVPSGPGSSTITVPVSGDKSTVHVSASVSGTTATVSKIDTSQIENVIGDNGQASMVEIDFTGLGKTIDTVKLPAAAIKYIAAKAQNEEVGGLTVKLPEAEISFDANALSAIQAQAGSQITLTVTPAKPADLNSRQKEAVGSAPVFDLTLRSSSGAITDFRGGYATVSLPYTLAAGQNPSGVVVYYLDSTGNITPCTTMYDVRSKSAIFTTGHLSLYFVGYDPAAVWENLYSDVAEGAWYYNAVRYASENGLMGGYGNGKFGPNDNLSRAQFAQILFNKEGRPVVNYLLRYNDVADGAWYTEAVRWATSQGVVSGYGNGMFGPNDNITREQLAVMLWRYAGSPAATDKELHFTDADKASGYALEALRWAVENGIINGYGDGQLAPQGLATRGQVAQMLMNFLKNR